MPKHHPRPCIPHHHTDLLTQSRLIAMDGTLRAGRLVGLERTLIEALPSVLQKLLTVLTETSVRPVPVPASDAYHSFDGPSLPRQSRMLAIYSHYGSLSTRTQLEPILRPALNP
jgi:hypothetical protein